MVETLNAYSSLISAIATIVIAWYAIVSNKVTSKIAKESLEYQRQVRNVMMGRFGMEAGEKILRYINQPNNDVAELHNTDKNSDQ